MSKGGAGEQIASQPQGIAAWQSDNQSCMDSRFSKPILLVVFKFELRPEIFASQTIAQKSGRNALKRKWG